jgi:hypothetical protein
VAVDTAITNSRAAAAAYGINVNAASDSVAAARAYLAPLVRSGAAAAELLGGASAFTLPFQPVCAPVCVNIGSFAQMISSASCVCGADKLNAIAGAAAEGVRVGAVALAGAAAMYVGAAGLLVVLTVQFVTARYDRSAARLRHRRAQRDYENGCVADPADCVSVAAAAPAQLQAGDVEHDDVRGVRDAGSKPAMVNPFAQY